MARPTLAIYSLSFNVNRIRYPWKACLASALALADKVFWCDCHSGDGTWEELQEIAEDNPALEIMKHPWDSHYSILPKVCNGILERILHEYDYALHLQADEVMCEWSFDVFRRELERMHASNVDLGRPHYTHFCPNFETTFPFIYDRKATLSRTRSNIRWSTGYMGDATSMVGGSQSDLSLEIFHYGKCQAGRRREALLKELTFQELYRELGFPDPKVIEQKKRPDGINYPEVFTSAQFTPYTGPHPVFMNDWIAEAKARA